MVYRLGKTADMGFDSPVCKLIRYLRKKHLCFAYISIIYVKGDVFFASKNNNYFSVNIIGNFNEWSMVVK